MIAYCWEAALSDRPMAVEVHAVLRALLLAGTDAAA
jgi:hypothetical protein